MERDGSLCDIYIEDVSLDDWDQFLSALSTRGEDFELLGGDPDQGVSVPSAASIFDRNAQATWCLRLKVGETDLHCHFFHPTEMEFDFDPRDLKSEQSLDPILQFMQWAGTLAKKTVLLCDENHKPNPICTYDPDIDALIRK